MLTLAGSGAYLTTRLFSDKDPIRKLKAPVASK